LEYAKPEAICRKEPIAMSTTKYTEESLIDARGLLIDLYCDDAIVNTAMAEDLSQNEIEALVNLAATCREGVDGNGEAIGGPDKAEAIDAAERALL
jgi:regulator of RNase E activity RraB